jgi:hypothetical protein
MQYLVVETSGADGYESRHRLNSFGDSYARDLRQSRAASVGLPRREVVEVTRQPVYNGLYSSHSRYGSRAPSVSAFEREPTHHRTIVNSLHSTSSLHGLPPVPDRLRRRGLSSTSSSHVYRPSIWYVGTAGFHDESLERSRRLESRLDGLLSYEPPSMDYYLNMKQSLRGINERMVQHRQLIDRYAGIDMAPAKPVEEAVEDRYYELVERMPHLERGSSVARSRAPSEEFTRSRSVAPLPNRDRATTPSLGTSEASAVRGKIRRLLNKTKHSS